MSRDLRACSIAECDRPVDARGWCKLHHRRWRRTGDPLKARRYSRHGMSQSPEYHTWEGMKDRCLNPNDDRYPRYGGRGVTVYQPWIDSFEAFFAYVGPKPGAGYSIDRIDNDGNYEPGNVRWATVEQQVSNKTHHKSLTTACPRGHRYDTYVRADGRRECRACRRAEGRRRFAPSGERSPSD